jgi:hypothetical protein
MGRPKGSKNEKNDNLQAFAIRVERQILQSNPKKQESIERLVCRLMTGKKNPGVAAVLASKWVEWRYGKPTEKHEHQVNVELQIGDADRIISGYFSLATSGSHQAGEGDTGQAAQQDHKLLPS